ncbi:MAG: hypothetical protein OSB09_05320 [Planctomycetota bacterium]|nr:hypothetical protein [Planctomycetota bacterium]
MTDSQQPTTRKTAEFRILRGGMAMLAGFLLISSSLSPSLMAADASPRKALIQATINLAKMATESGYRNEIGIVGGLSSSADHRIEVGKYRNRIQTDVRGRLMHFPDYNAFLLGEKVAIEEEGVWMKPGTSRLGREIGGLFEVPTDLLTNALKSASQIEWVTNRRDGRKAIQVVMTPRRSRARFNGIDKSGCVAAEGRRLSYFQTRLERSNTQTTITVQLDAAGEMPQKISVEVLGAYRDEQGRSRKGQLAFEEGTIHAAFHFIYWIDSSVAVSQFKVPLKAQKLLR